MALIDRASAESLIPEEVANEILGEVAEASVAMALGKRLPNMSRKQKRLPVWATLPTAAFADGDSTRAPITTAGWDDKFINAEKLFATVAIPNDVIDDADYDMWGELRPAIVSAIAAAWDAAVWYGAGKPALWEDGIVEQCAGKTTPHTVTIGALGDLYDDVLGEGGVLSMVEEDGFMVNGHVAALGMRSKFRGLRDTDGQPIFASARQEAATTYALDGERLEFPRNGVIDSSVGAAGTRSHLISGDFDKLVWAMRRDMTIKISGEAILQNPDGSIAHNMFQEEGTAMLVSMRGGWATPNPINLVEGVEAERYPFAALIPAIA